MRATSSACVLLVFIAVGAVFADQCSVVTKRAPCGQVVDNEQTCLAKGCCFDGSDTKNPCFYPNYNAVNITRVYVIQACHFDAGFADTTVNILNRWFDEFFPLAASIGNALCPDQSSDVIQPCKPNGNNTAGAQLRFMAQSWIVSLYTDCPPNAGLHCPNASALATFASAVQKGYITWHAFPFNAEMEIYNQDMIAAGVSLTNDLDSAYKVRQKTVLSQRDVPGMSVASIPALLASGVRGITVGVNGGSTPPSVPRAFVWQDPVSGKSIPAMWHPGGYGGITYEDAIILPGTSIALVPDWRGDNAGPPPAVDDVYSDWAAIASVFPGAQIVSATWEDWMDVVQGAVHTLPTISKEIGETWIHGLPSDPHKQSWYKQWQQLRSDCIAAKVCDPSEYALKNFTRFLLKAGEHTDGKDVKTFLHDTVNWSNDLFEAALPLPNFQDMVASWVEQRTFAFDYSLGALPASHPLYAPLQQAKQSVYPPSQPNPNAPGWIPFIPNSGYTAGRYTIGFDPTTGAISQLVDAVTGQTWANGANNEFLAFLEYQTYTEDVYTAFIANYSYAQPPPSWFLLDFGKPNVSLANPQYQRLQQTLGGIWLSTDENAAHFIIETVFLDGDGNTTPNTEYGAPQIIWTLIDVPTIADSSRNSVINVTLQMYGKTATRLPEAMFLRFNASSATASGAPGSGQFYVDLYDELMDPYDVQLRGNQKHHGVHGGLVYTKQAVGRNADRASVLNSNATMYIACPHTPVSAFGVPFGLPTPTTVTADKSEGAAILLFDNTWGTNYPMWVPFEEPQDANIQWVFKLVFPSQQ